MIGAQCEFTLWDQNGDSRSTTIPLGSEIVIGRSRSADVVIDNPSVSARHARFRLRGRLLEVEDLQSSYGTYVDGERTEGWTSVAAGVDCWLGDARLTATLLLPTEPVVVRVSNATHQVAFTLDGVLDTLGARELSPFPQLSTLAPLHFARRDGAIAEIRDAHGTVHVLADGAVQLAGVSFSCVSVDDSMASVLAPRPDVEQQPSSDSSLEPPAPGAPDRPETRPEIVPVEPADEVARASAPVGRGTGADRLLLAIALAAAAFFVAVALWIL